MQQNREQVKKDIRLLNTRGENLVITFIKGGNRVSKGGKLISPAEETPREGHFVGVELSALRSLGTYLLVYTLDPSQSQQGGLIASRRLTIGARAGRRDLSHHGGQKHKARKDHNRGLSINCCLLTIADFLTAICR